MKFYMAAANLLLADDDDNDVLLLKEAFSVVNCDFQLTRVSDGDAVLALFRDGAPAPAVNLIVLDYYLPRRNGAQVAEQLHQWGVLPKIPVVILSSHLSAEECRRLGRLGVAMVGEKPGDFDGLCALARELVQLASA